MQLLATAEQMRSYDRTAIESLGIPGLVLMENAGRAFVDILERRAGVLADRTAIVLCGKGNNGGDGSVIARHLANRGCTVHLYLLARRGEVTGDAKVNLDALRAMVPLARGSLKVVEGAGARQLAAAPPADVAVDAIFGTGFTGAAKGIAAQAIQFLNEQRGLVASVDIPSGVNADTGAAEGPAVKAALTVAMGLAKNGHYLGEGRELSGEVVVADISIPKGVIRTPRGGTFRVEAADVGALLPRRPLRAHKYSVGKVLVLGGSRKFTGAPCMSALGAMRAGAGAVVLAIPKSIHTVLARKLTEVILEPQEETSGGTLSRDAIDEIRDRARWADAVAVGPGLSRDEETDKLVLQLLAELTVPVVVDADALTAIAAEPEVLKRRKGESILTPHSGELARLTGTSSAVIEADRLSAARSAARRLHCIVVLKGAPTVTALPDGTAYVNSTGNPGMATIGTGDVLTGIIVSLLAQGMEPGPAAYAGVFLHGLSGDLAASHYGERSILATDLLGQLPAAFLSVGS